MAFLYLLKLVSFMVTVFERGRDRSQGMTSTSNHVFPRSYSSFIYHNTANRNSAPHLLQPHTPHKLRSTLFSDPVGT